MSHEPNRERHMVYRCEQCGNGGVPLSYLRLYDQYWCAPCIDSLVCEEELEILGDE